MASHVLIIDDRHSEVWFIERVLQKLGYEVSMAFDGLEGLSHIKERAPDLIILDTIMPKMDGYKVYQNLKMNPDTADIPV
ncbi:MAG: response regulator, partial [Dehalococcoidales bacterium]